MRKLLLPLLCLSVAVPALIAGAKSESDKPAENKQTKCPISGKAIDEAASVEHDGQKVYFCCGNCAAKFEKEPMKYMPAVYKQLYPQSIQLKCPFSGEPIDPAASADLEGRTVYFCCNNCVAKAKKDPAKALTKLDEASTKQVHCPMSGKAINAKVSAESDGKTVYFCCDGCAKHFKDDAKAAAEATTPDVGVLAFGPNAKEDLVLAGTCDDKGTTTLKRKDAKAVVHHGKRFFAANADCAAKIDGHQHQHVDAIMKALKEKS
jgi:YHS domain-containing protein